MQLEKPGAGLPDFERLFIKNILVPVVRTLFTWNIALFLLKRESRIIMKLIKGIDRSTLEQKIIIDRTFAIEDDSRQYSINMVLEHLSIAGYGVMNVIDTLSKEEEFTDELTIVGVKPFQNPKNAQEIFMEFMNKYEYFINNLPKKHSHMTKKHPWFVKFNNNDWSLFMYMHTFIHRRQIQAILSKLGNENV